MSPTPRLQGVEFLRLAAATGVILIHFWPNRTGAPPLIDHLVIGSMRFGVPFFFAASGFFMGRKLASPRDGGMFAWRWVRILVGWHAVHAAWFTLLHLLKTPDPLSHAPLWLDHLMSWDGLMEGVAWPLWYLHSLVLCVVLVSFVPARRRGLLLPLAGALFFAALLWGPWAALRPDWFPVNPGVPMNPRGFLFSALLPFLLGHSFTKAPSFRRATILVAIGFAMQTVEILCAPHGARDRFQEFYLGSVLAGWGLLELGLTWNPGWLGNRPWGVASLPMYLCQLIVFSFLVKLVAFVMPSSTWIGSAVHVTLSLPLYILLCQRIGQSAAWKRIHG